METGNYTLYFLSSDNLSTFNNISTKGVRWNINWIFLMIQFKDTEFNKKLVKPFYYITACVESRNET